MKKKPMMADIVKQMSKKTGPFEMVAIDTQEQESGQVLHTPQISLNTTRDNYNTL